MIVVCPVCGTAYEVEDGDILIAPWPHVICPKDGEWIPVYDK